MGAQPDEARRRAVLAARLISTHHLECAVCARGGRLVAGRRGLRREPCKTERCLFGQLEAARAEGWPTCLQHS